MDNERKIRIHIEKLLLKKGAETIVQNFYNPFSEILLSVAYHDRINKKVQILPNIDKKAYSNYLVKLSDHNTRKIEDVNYEFVVNSHPENSIFFSLMLIDKLQNLSSTADIINNLVKGDTYETEYRTLFSNQNLWWKLLFGGELLTFTLEEGSHICLQSNIIELELTIITKKDEKIST